jgi:pSer/pThr/pTyr-binding forkhead associated (FHA) protein
VNDHANHFRDLCGVPLKLKACQNGVVSVNRYEAAVTSMNTSNIICPQCGQENLPGTAFCDNCGAALPQPQPVSDFSPAQEAAPVATLGGQSTGQATVTCPQCGSPNTATNRFCEQCGTSLSNVTGVQQAADKSIETSGAGVRTEQPQSPQVTEPRTDQEMASSELDTVSKDELGTEDGSAHTQAPSTASAPSSADERQRLEETIATQRRVIEQLEQMQSTFGAATPAAVLQGLEEARQKLAQAESDLQALPADQPSVDPAEVARLEEEIGTRRRLVTQLEQMQSTFGDATPPAVLQGLGEARANLAEAESKLQTLIGTAPADTATPQRDQTAQSGEAAAPQGQAQVAPQEQDIRTGASDGREAPAQAPEQPSALQPQAEPQAAPINPAVVEQPTAETATQAQGRTHLLTRDGQKIMLPRIQGDVLVGRQDPVSGVYPAVDLTPYGGEAGGVSRRHALLREQNGRWTVTDLDSTNYTRIDGNRIAPHTPTEIEDGERLQFGQLELVFHTS